MAGQAAARRRTGVITEKLGMSRVFNDAGEHVPVTVLTRGRLPGHRPADAR